MTCLDTIARYLLYAFLIDVSLELLDLAHRIYEADESFRTLDFMVHTRLFVSQIVLQLGVGTLVPVLLLTSARVWDTRPTSWNLRRGRDWACHSCCSSSRSSCSAC